MTALPSYKKCYRCGHETTDSRKTACECGDFLYTISSIYTPKVAKKTEDKRA